MLRLLVLSFILLGAVQVDASTLHIHSHSRFRGPHVIVVKVSEGHLLRGYLAWIHSHPQARPKSPKGLSSSILTGDQPLSQAEKTSHPAVHLGSDHSQESSPFLIHTPSIDLYSPVGKSIFYSYNTKKNAAFLRGLPKSIDSRAYRGTGELRPTLSEAVKMLPELRKYAPTVLAADGYTVFALTCTTSHCEPQQNAVTRITGHLQGTDIRVIELLIP